ncbi:MAG TPA: glycine rich domain-containing protein, partial [Fluviicola sp.]|nr:glycine rich domain-containing protein [Fluviicola sp.]
MKKGIFIAVLFVFITISNFYFSQSITFNYTGAPQTWTVPACVSNITVTVAGAEGGGGNGGNGAIVTATLTVNPGDVLNLYVGGSGQCPGNGWNGGGIGHATSSGTTTWNSCGGGGASDIRIGGTGLANRIVVASGGGGEG